MAIESGMEHDVYLQQLFPGGTLSIAIRDFIFQTCSIINFISPTLKTINENVYVPNVLGITKSWIYYQFYHKEWAENLSARTINKYFNNKKNIQITRLEKNR